MTTDKYFFLLARGLLSEQLDNEIHNTRSPQYTSFIVLLAPRLFKFVCFNLIQLNSIPRSNQPRRCIFPRWHWHEQWAADSLFSFFTCQERFNLFLPPSLSLSLVSVFDLINYIRISYEDVPLFHCYNYSIRPVVLLLSHIYSSHSESIRWINQLYLHFSTINIVSSHIHTNERTEHTHNTTQYNTIHSSRIWLSLPTHTHTLISISLSQRGCHALCPRLQKLSLLRRRSCIHLCIYMHTLFK